MENKPPEKKVKPTFDIVLMDVSMPELDGKLVCGHVLHRLLPPEQTTRLIMHLLTPNEWPYVLALTGNTTYEDRMQCIEAGMQGLIVKPARVGHLQEAFERFFVERES